MPTAAPLKAPVPYFGGKGRIAHVVWDRLGAVENYCEPFCGSAAVLLRRPAPWQGVETINDADCYVSNFWRATATDPEAVAAHADWPVSEVDLHSRHRWLVMSDEAAYFRQQMRTDPTYYDTRIAGWWAWGLSCWIGGGWCKADQLERHKNSLPAISGQKGIHGKGHTADQAIRPRLVRGNGVHAGRPQLADAYDIGRGVNSNGSAQTEAERRKWLVGWFGRLRDRLRLVRVCCGDWLRVCDSPSVTTRLGRTGIFFDPPYGADAGRDMSIYSTESGTVAADVLAYCRERGSNPDYRIVLAGYEGEHDVLEKLGWTVHEWQAQGGYGNRTKDGRGRENAKRERLWCSPHCHREPTLFDAVT